MLTEEDIDDMFPSCGHAGGYGDSSRCEGMPGPCRMRKARTAGLKMLGVIEELSGRLDERDDRGPAA